MKKIHYLISLSIIITTLISSCTKNETEGYSLELIDKIKPLQFYTTSEIVKLGTIHWSDSTQVYNLEGNDVSREELNFLLINKKVKQHFYFDSNSDLKAVVLVPLSNEELKFNILKSESLINSKAPNFNVYDIYGNKFTDEDLKGKVIVMNFWFTGCKPCVKEIPELNKLVEHFKAEDVVFLSFARNSRNEVEGFLKKKEFNYAPIIADKDILALYSVNVFPTNLIIDKNSQVVFFDNGLKEDIFFVIKDEVEKLL
jgi:thiol-disulfide isomerase/thioredoxin